jgi:predicted nucleotidyltransferase
MNDGTEIVNENHQQKIVDILLRNFPDLEVVYLFGSFGTPFEWVTSDVDVAVLLTPIRAKFVTSKELLAARYELENALARDVDLVNIREANTVFRHEVLKDVRRIYCANPFAADVFEMLTMSFYQKLNEERAEILDQVSQSGRILAP